MIENVVFSNWVGELTSTVGDGPISLGGAINGFSSFSQFPDGSKVVYTIQDGFDKETGVGTLNGRALERTTIRATLVDGVYTISSSPLKLSGNSQVYATMNAELMKELKDAHGDISDIMQRTINGHPLTTDVLLSASDVGAQAESPVLDKIVSGVTATTTEAGVVNLATTSEAVVGTDNSKALTPNAGVALAAYQIIAEHYRKQGMVTAGTFEDGAHVINANQVVISRANGVGYTYLGTIATGGFDVVPGSTPDANWKAVVTDTTSAEISIGDAPPANAKATSLWYNTLDGRMYIRYQDADSLQWVEASPQSSIADIPEDVSNKIREALRRSYAETGYNLVSGSFEAGGTLTSPTDVLLHEAAWKAYSWTGSYPIGGYVVASGSTPTSSGGMGISAWEDKSDSTLSHEMVVIVKTFNSIAEMKSAVGLRVGDSVNVLDYYGGSSSNNSGVMQFKIVASLTGIDDGGAFIDCIGCQAMQIFKRGIPTLKQYGGNDKGKLLFNNSPYLQKALDYMSCVAIDNSTVGYLLNESINCTNRFGGVTIVCDGHVGNGGIGTWFWGNTGERPIFDFVGSERNRLSGWGIGSATGNTNPSKCGLLFARSDVNNYAQFNSLTDIAIKLDIDDTAFGGKGTVGLVNIASEIFSMKDFYFIANTPLYIGRSNFFGVSSYATIYTGKTSTSDITFDGACTLDSNGTVGTPLHLNGAQVVKGKVYTNGRNGSVGDIGAGAVRFDGACTNIYMKVFVEFSTHVAYIDNGFRDSNIEFIGAVNANRYILTNTGFTGFKITYSITTSGAFTAPDYFIAGESNDSFTQCKITLPYNPLIDFVVPTNKQFNRVMCNFVGSKARDETFTKVISNTFEVANGTTGVGATINFLTGAGATPEGTLTAATGSLCLVNAAGVGKLFIKTSGSGNTGWVAVS